jgi:hypothetical protein
VPAYAPSQSSAVKKVDLQQFAAVRQDTSRTTTHSPNENLFDNTRTSTSTTVEMKAIVTCPDGPRRDPPATKQTTPVSQEGKLGKNTSSSSRKRKERAKLEKKRYSVKNSTSNLFSLQNGTAFLDLLDDDDDDDYPCLDMGGKNNHNESSTRIQILTEENAPPVKDTASDVPSLLFQPEAYAGFDWDDMLDDDD